MRTLPMTSPANPPTTPTNTRLSWKLPLSAIVFWDEVVVAWASLDSGTNDGGGLGENASSTAAQDVVGWFIEAATGHVVDVASE